MSYYQKSNFKFTNHAIARAKQRIPFLGQMSDLMIQSKILEFLEIMAVPDFFDRNYQYFRINWAYQNYLYVVATKTTNIIVTITTISHAKKINLLR